MDFVGGPFRVVVAKPGLDGHDRGVRVVVRALRDAGFEVLYLGLFQTAESIAKVAVDEDVDAVGLSSLSGAHNTLFPDVVERLREVGLGDVVVFGGGVMTAADIERLTTQGIDRIFTPGTPLREITTWLSDALTARARARQTNDQ